MKTITETRSLAEIAQTTSTGILLSFLKTAQAEDAEYIDVATKELAKRQPTIVNKDNIFAFNIIRFNNIYVKNQVKKNSYSYDLLNVTKTVYFIEINHTQRTLKVNGKSFKLIFDSRWTYKLDKRSKTIYISGITNFQEHLFDNRKPKDFWQASNCRFLDNLLNLK